MTRTSSNDVTTKSFDGPRSRGRAVLRLAGLLLVLILAGGCSGDDGASALPDVEGGDGASSDQPSDTASGDVTEIGYGDEAGPTMSEDDQARIAEVSANLAGLATADWTGEERSAQAKTDALELSDDQLEELLSSYNQFLITRDGSRLGSPEALDQLRTLAAPTVVADAEQWRDDNQALEDIGAHIGSVVSLSNPKVIAGDDQQVTINDCLEERIGAATMLLGATNYVDQIVTLTMGDDGWLVTAVEIRHDGTVDEDRPGCVPSVHGDEVERVVAEYLTIADGLWQEPTADSAPLAGLASDEVLASVQTIQQAMADQGVHVPQAQLHEITAVGSDPTYGNAWFLAEVCTSLPEGLAPVYVDSGQPVPATDGGYEMTPGTSTLREVLVLLEADPAGEISGTVSRIETKSIDSDCDRD